MDDKTDLTPEQMQAIVACAEALKPDRDNVILLAGMTITELLGRVNTDKDLIFEFLGMLTGFLTTAVAEGEKQPHAEVVLEYFSALSLNLLGAPIVPVPMSVVMGDPVDPKKMN